MKPRLTGKEIKSERREVLKVNMETTLDNIEELWLNQGHMYLVGHQISYADILCACELEQPRKRYFKHN